MDIAKKIIIGTCVLGAVLLAGFGYAAFFIIGIMRSAPEPREFPSALKEPHVESGDSTFQKQLFFEGVRLGTVSDIQLNWSDEDGRSWLVLVGNRSALFLDSDRKVHRTVTFPRTLASMQVVRLEAAGRYGFVRRGYGWGEVALFDSNGSKLWAYNPARGVNEVAVGDVDGDGKSEMALGHNADGGIVLMDLTGKIIWKKPDGNVWHVEIVDIDGDGRGKILHSNVAGDLVIRDATGTVLNRLRPAHYTNAFAPTQWGADPRVNHVVVLDENALHVLSPAERRSTRLEVPFLDRYASVTGTPVTFSPGARPHYASLTEYSTWDRSLLYIHDADGKVVYHEVLGEECRALARWPRETAEALLVGCNNRVWVYSPAANGK